MAKEVFVSGLLGGVTLFVWTFVVSGLFGFNSSVKMKQIPNERQVYEVLKENIVEPGRYSSDPPQTAEGLFPGGEPVFSVLYGGVGHESAGKLMMFGLVFGFLATIAGAWLLSQASERVMTSYPRKVIFFSVIGLLIAVFTDLTNYGIGNYPLSDALILAVHNILVWTIIGLVVAWRMKPDNGALEVA